MAFYDNKYWVLSHIRNSFLYSDDTGMCEMVLRYSDIPEEIISEGKQNWYGDLDDSGEEYDDDGRIAARSLSNGYDGDFGARRRRLNTAVRLDRLHREQQAAAMIQNVRWKDPEEVHSEEDQNLFPKKKIVPQKARTGSALSQLIAETTTEVPTLYMEYAKFDGSIQTGVATRTIRIYVHVSGVECNYPITICIISSAKVSELVGLTCYTYNCQKHQPAIKEPIDNFALFIAEDDGSPDKDFPCLDPRENIGKFGFTTLSMVKITAPVHHASHPSEAECELVPSPAAETCPVQAPVSATDHQTFKCFLLQKIRPKTEVSVGISWDQVDLKAVPGSRSSITVATFLWPRHSFRPLTLPIDVVADCTLILRNPPTLAIVYYHVEGRRWRRLRLETESKTAEQIMSKLMFILEIRGGHYRHEYLALNRTTNTSHTLTKYT